MDDFSQDLFMILSFDSQRGWTKERDLRTKAELDAEAKATETELYDRSGAGEIFEFGEDTLAVKV